ncbi:LOW QUALITY PROTEIN: hypothetical protein V2J09_002310 [Rumex salicifolius]
MKKTGKLRKRAEPYVELVVMTMCLMSFGFVVTFNWFYGKCVKVTPAKAEHMKQYKCPGCSNKSPSSPGYCLFIYNLS